MNTAQFIFFINRYLGCFLLFVFKNNWRFLHTVPCTHMQVSLGLEFLLMHTVNLQQIVANCFPMFAGFHQHCISSLCCIFLAPLHFYLLIFANLMSVRQHCVVVLAYIYQIINEISIYQSSERLLLLTICSYPLFTFNEIV